MQSLKHPYARVYAEGFTEPLAKQRKSFEDITELNAGNRPEPKLAPATLPREMALEPRAMVAKRKPNGFLPSQTTVQHRRYERRH